MQWCFEKTCWGVDDCWWKRELANEDTINLVSAEGNDSNAMKTAMLRWESSRIHAEDLQVISTLTYMQE